jgi:bifunctional UDP-N-acetylglucosamine pyrophosphorylase/glucosamine-1-phosphate N-acetyltransferase
MAPKPALATLILAAGKGTRMKSRLPKVLQPVCGRPMLAFVLDAAAALSPERRLVVVGHGADPVRMRFPEGVEFVLQAEQRGTGHAVLQCREALEGFRGEVLILYGDTPLLRGETLLRMRQHKVQTGADLVLLSAAVPVPGIVLRDASGKVKRIVDAPDATPEQLEIEERNTGVYLIGADLLWKLLAQVGDDNAQGEVYLTDIVELAVRERLAVEALRLDPPEEAIGVNSRAELATAAAAMRARILNRLMEAGVTVVDPATTFVDADVEIGADTVIEPGCVIHGPTRIGEGVHIKPHCTIEASRIGDDVQIGPCAHVRPDCVIGRGSRIGNFVEVKNSVLGEGVKADHLSYVGDADVGERASFGCGAIVVNYDGIAKHRTRVGARAFIGCNVNLVAPVTIEPDAFVAAGSTITRDVPSEALAVARERQRNVEGWVARRRKRGD